MLKKLTANMELAANVKYAASFKKRIVIMNLKVIFILLMQRRSDQNLYEMY
jgi:hypothetical protein